MLFQLPASFAALEIYDPTATALHVSPHQGASCQRGRGDDGLQFDLGIRGAGQPQVEQALFIVVSFIGHPMHRTIYFALRSLGRTVTALCFV